MNISERVVKMVTEELVYNHEEVRPESKLAEDLGADSLDHIDLVMAIEQEFKIEISDETSEKLKTVQDIIDLVERSRHAIS